ncbi:carbon storage regulator CsrA [Lacisediminihabitans profunda]|uniref:Translational regulator CsrA n=1 Tax=Lacisediminihabitans profunda TaxID=2594790 RepID=A0A5C8ULH7_9MICO|nr:carbon storage regulator CsrA [Lacisediminihabitans profunda]TXN29195.1 carbon storage regulator [Lacisediminihabitans profunda]
MLVLTRKAGERILIGDDIVITILDSRGDGIRIGIDAPRGVKIQREEVLRAVTEANLAAAKADEGDEDRIKAALGLLPTAPQAAAPLDLAPEASADRE